MKFYYCEVQNRHSYQKAFALKATNLSDATKEAEQEQTFCGTVLQVGSSLDSNGFLKTVDAMKNDGEEWEFFDDEVE